MALESPLAFSPICMSGWDGKGLSQHSACFCIDSVGGKMEKDRDECVCIGSFFLPTTNLYTLLYYHFPHLETAHPWRMENKASGITDRW